MKGSTRWTRSWTVWRRRETWEGVILIKSDPGPAVKRLVKDLVEARAEGKSVVEESPVGSSGSNGVVERTVQAVEEQIRVILLALEARLGRMVAANEPIVTYTMRPETNSNDFGRVLELIGRFEFDFRRRGIFGVFKVQSHIMWPYMCMCCGLFVPITLSFQLWLCS